jgi:hypothetical protein
MKAASMSRLPRIRPFSTWLIPRAAKPNLRNELALLGIDDFTIYGDMVHLASRLTAAYRS